MDRTLTWTLALVALLMTAPAVAAADAPTAPDAGTDSGPCDLFWYTIDPPGYHLDLNCLPIPLPFP